jgi:glycine/D-amino acid oxidase-like deaminating enzyme
LFVPPGDPIDELEYELDACHRAGLSDVSFVHRAPIDGFETGRCLRFPRQAEFHPMRYLTALERAILRNGVQVYTGTHATTVEDGRHGGRAQVGTKNGPTVTARDVVVATNVPIHDLLKLHTKQYPYRTYVIGAHVPKGSVAHALFWDTAHPYHYVRLLRNGDPELLIVGGEDHKTGQEPKDADPHQRLEEWARERFPAMKDVVYRMVPARSSSRWTQWRSSG